MKKSRLELDSEINKVLEANTYNALKLLIDNSYLTQSARPRLFKAYKPDDLGLLKELCTVKMCTSRQSGHSVAACKIAFEYFNDVLFLSPNLDMAKRNMQRFIHFNSEGLMEEGPAGANIFFRFLECRPNEVRTQISHYEFNTYGDGFADRMCSTPNQYEAIIVDGTFGLTEKKENEIYYLVSYMKKYEHKYFVFIQ